MTNRDRPELFIRVVLAWIAIVFIGIGAMVYRHRPEVVKLSDDKIDIRHSVVHYPIGNAILVANGMIDINKPICDLSAQWDTVISDTDTTIYYIISQR